MVKPKVNRKYRIHPALLEPNARRQHVVRSLLDYNRGIIESNPAGATAKFDKLKLSPFVFLRGTADLMYRHFAGTDADMANVLLMGDVHLENFGVMESADGSLIWGLNDFDEAAFGPFSWDVKRAATSTVLAAADRGFKRAERLKLAQALAAAYLAGIQEADTTDAESKPRFTKKRGTPLVKKLIGKAARVDPKAWLDEYITADDRFRETDEVQPLSKRTRGFQKEIDAYLASLAGHTENVPEQLIILDVATKTGSGTGSIGLWRFYALSEAKFGDRSEKLILEIKRQRPSVLAPYVSEGPFLFQSDGSRVAFAQEIQLPHANPYYGHTTLDKLSYLVRKKSPFKKRVKLGKLTKFKDFRDYVAACGTALAFAHARTDRAFEASEPSSEFRILQSVNPSTFASDIGHYATRMARHVTADWKIFLKAQVAGEFTFAEQQAKQK